LGIIAYILALHAEGIYNLVKDASSFGSAGIFIVLIFGLFTKLGGVKSAIAALICGAFVWIVSHYFLEFKWSYMLSLTLSFVFYISIALLETWFAKLKKKFLFQKT
jgi:SSS family solute:Na+ symporter